MSLRLTRRLSDCDCRLSESREAICRGSTSFCGWGAGTPSSRKRIGIGDAVGLEALLLMFLLTAICMPLVDVTVIISKVIVWGRGMQLYFMAAMSPIPQVLLDVGEARQMGIGYLRNFESLVRSATRRSASRSTSSRRCCTWSYPQAGRQAAPAR